MVGGGGQALVSKVSTVPGTGILPRCAFVGFFSAIPMTAITTPFERIKIILQIQDNQMARRSNILEASMHCVGSTKKGDYELVKTQEVPVLIRG